ncbi:hypothetical protein EV127DRAFT_500459 [Xylaria flabelliformis]|nr:hypothetical protein EV127DRAFT_500459 [Xylaria flabelliformis]
MTAFLKDLKSSRQEVYSILVNLIETCTSVSNAELSRFYEALTRARLEDGGDINSMVLGILLKSGERQTDTSAEGSGPKLSVHDMYIMEVEEATRNHRGVAEITEKYAKRLHDTWHSISDLRDRVGAYKLTNKNLMSPFIHEFYFWRRYFTFHIMEFEAINDSLGRTALHFVTSQLHLDYFDMECWKNIFNFSDGKLNVRDHFGRTPLHIACAADCRERPDLQLKVIQTLLRANANISIRDEYGLLAIERAVLGNRIDILEVFQEVKHLNLSEIFFAMGRAQEAINVARDLVKTKTGGTGVLYVIKESDSNNQTEASDSGLLHEVKKCGAFSPSQLSVSMSLSPIEGDTVFKRSGSSGHGT